MSPVCASYCLKCKRTTDTNNIIESISKNGKNYIRGKCVECGSKKSHFAKSGGCLPCNKTGGDIQKFLSKLPGTPWAKYPGEKHLPGYSYCGPNTRLDIRLDENDSPKPGEEPINRVDATYRF